MVRMQDLELRRARLRELQRQLEELWAAIELTEQETPNSPMLEELWEKLEALERRERYLLDRLPRERLAR